MEQGIILVSTSGNPYANIATERLLMDVVKPNEQIMFLWQNMHTIVIGRNQNAYQECRIEEFEKDGGRLARRLSGGGAVYHDRGNLNFTFISPRATYDVARNMNIICDAVRSFGLEAETSGRNDIEIDGAKFSGNAFFKTKNACCHHGTLMVDVDMQKLAQYLNPDPRKLQTKGVASVRSRVVNLQDLKSSLTVETLSDALITSFTNWYGTSVREQADTLLDRESFQLEQDFLASDEWRYGKEYAFDRRLDFRYAWGGIDLRFREEDGRMKDVAVYSDALDAEFADDFALALEGADLGSRAFEECVKALIEKEPTYREMLEDCLLDMPNDLNRGE